MTDLANRTNPDMRFNDPEYIRAVHSNVLHSAWYGEQALHTYLTGDVGMIDLTTKCLLDPSIQLKTPAGTVQVSGWRTPEESGTWTSAFTDSYFGLPERLRTTTQGLYDALSTTDVAEPKERSDPSRPEWTCCKHGLLPVPSALTMAVGRTDWSPSGNRGYCTSHLVEPNAAVNILPFYAEGLQRWEVGLGMWCYNVARLLHVIVNASSGTHDVTLTSRLLSLPSVDCSLLNVSTRWYDLGSFLTMDYPFGATKTPLVIPDPGEKEPIVLEVPNTPPFTVSCPLTLDPWSVRVLVCQTYVSQVYEKALMHPEWWNAPYNQLPFPVELSYEITGTDGRQWGAAFPFW